MAGYKWTKRMVEMAAGLVGATDFKSNGIKTNKVVESTASNGVAVQSRLTTTDGVASGTAKVVGGVAYAMAAASTALTNSNAEAVLGSYTIPANTLKAGTVVRVRFQGIATATHTTDTLTIKLRLGATTLTGTALITTSAVDVADGNIFTGELLLTSRAAPSATSALVGVGRYSDPGAAGGAFKTVYLAATNFATNGALKLEVTGTWSVADVGNSCRLDVMVVEVI